MLRWVRWLAVRVSAWIAQQSATSNRIMAVSAEMTLASTRHSPVGQRNLLSQQKVRGAQRTGAFGSEGWVGTMMCKVRARRCSRMANG